MSALTAAARIDLISVDRGPDGTIALAGGGAPPLFAGPTWGTEGDAWIAALAADGGHQWMQRLDTFTGGPHVAVADDGAVVAAFQSAEVEVQGMTVGSSLGVTIIKLGP